MAFCVWSSFRRMLVVERLEFFSGCEMGEFTSLSDHTISLEALTSFFSRGGAQDFWFRDADWAKILKSTLGRKTHRHQDCRY